ncbi:MAG TPA: cytochrome c [Steroidobacteraceae bacterium]|nr:cytochrome c [Steroidobacteraceae bacterium]
MRGTWLRSALAIAATAAIAVARGSPAQDYMLYCQGCHGDQAQGVPGKVPPLAGSLNRFMRTADGRDYLLRVPGAANSALSDEQLTAVLNWLAERYALAGEASVPSFTVTEVARLRHTPLADVAARRAEVVRALAASGPSPPAGY